MINGLFREARPKQWAKNVLVFAAPGAAGVLDNGSFLFKTLLTFVAFCMVSSGTYYWNDIHDVEADRQHPKKRSRPIAAGVVPLGTAKVIGTVLLAGGVGVGFAVHWKLGVVTVGYVTLTTLYSTVLKHVAVVDLVTVATGFVLRAVAGAVASDVKMSTWFLLCTSFGSLFIVTGKRYAELREYGGAAGAARASLDDYTLGFLRIVLSVSIGATLVTYCIWALNTKELGGTTWPFYELSILPMSTAILRYTLILEQGHGAAPEEIFVSDRTLQVLGVLWIIVFGLGVYREVTSMRTLEAALTQVSEVKGWMSPDQAERLYRAAAATRPGDQIVEIGSFQGRSTIVLASAAPEAVPVVAIDPHAGNDRGPQELEGYAAEAASDHDLFNANLDAAGVRHHVRHVRKFSNDAHADVKGEIAVLYIDGAHRYRPARTDIVEWGARIAPGGTMLIHDSFSSLGVTMAILRELVGGRRFRYIGRARSLTEFRADLDRSGKGRSMNAARLLAQLPWFAKNLFIKVLISVKLGRLLKAITGRDPEWPY